MAGGFLVVDARPATAHKCGSELPPAPPLCSLGSTPVEVALLSTCRGSFACSRHYPSRVFMLGNLWRHFPCQLRKPLVAVSYISNSILSFLHRLGIDKKSSHARFKTPPSKRLTRKAGDLLCYSNAQGLVTEMPWTATLLLLRCVSPRQSNKPVPHAVPPTYQCCAIARKMIG